MSTAAAVLLYCGNVTRQWSYLTSWLSLAMSNAMRLAALMISLSRLDHCFTSMWSACAAIYNNSKPTILAEYSKNSFLELRTWNLTVCILLFAMQNTLQWSHKLFVNKYKTSKLLVGVNSPILTKQKTNVITSIPQQQVLVLFNCIVHTLHVMLYNAITIDLKLY